MNWGFYIANGLFISAMAFDSLGEFFAKHLIFALVPSLLTYLALVLHSRAIGGIAFLLNMALFLLALIVLQVGLPLLTALAAFPASFFNCRSLWLAFPKPNGRPGNA